MSDPLPPLPAYSDGFDPAGLIEALDCLDCEELKEPEKAQIKHLIHAEVQRRYERWLWQSAGPEGSLVEWINLRIIIQRAAAAIDEADMTAWYRACELVASIETPDATLVASTLFHSHRAVCHARSILNGEPAVGDESP